MVRGKLQSNATKSANTSNAGRRTGGSAKAATSSPALSQSKPASNDRPGLSVSSCSHCGTVIGDDGKALQCDRCKGANSWKCAECLNIGSDLYDKLVHDQNLDLRWFCDPCEKLIMDTHCNNTATQNDKIDSLISLVERLMSRYEAFENKLVEKCDTAEAVKLEARLCQLEQRFSKWDQGAEMRFRTLEEKVQSFTVDIPKQTDTSIKQLEERLTVRNSATESRLIAVEQKLSAAVPAPAEKENAVSDEDLIKFVVQEEMNKKTAEERDLENRKRNIILYRVPEKKTDSVPERKTSDTVFVKDFLDGVFNMKVDENEIEKMFRLGRWSEDKARPLLVAFRNIEQKENIMANLRNLRQPIDKFRGISISHDLHPKEREDIKLMVEEAKQKHIDDGGDAVENYRFLVVGKGERRKVIKIQRKN